MELGGNIELKGFLEVDSADLIIIKKIVGNYTKDLADAHDDFESITVALTAQSAPFTVVSAAVMGGSPVSSEQTDNNLYFALDASLKQVLALAAKR